MQALGVEEPQTQTSYLTPKSLRVPIISAIIHTKDGSMETAVGVGSLLESPMPIYRLILEQDGQYAESPHKERQTDRL